MPASCVARHLEPPRPAADAQQQVVVGELAAVVEPDAPRAAVDGRHAHAEPRLDAVLLVEVRAAQPQPLALELAGEVFLRQRRAVVGQVGLVAHQHDRARVALAAQRVDGLHRRVARADDDDPLCHCVDPPSALVASVAGRRYPDPLYTARRFGEEGVGPHVWHDAASPRRAPGAVPRRNAHTVGGQLPGRQRSRIRPGRLRRTMAAQGRTGRRSMLVRRRPPAPGFSPPRGVGTVSAYRLERSPPDNVTKRSGARAL